MSVDNPNIVLLQLSRELRQQGCYMQAAKCLTAASDCTLALPASRAVASIEYATLLMDHFDNLELARRALLRADQELRSARTQHLGLKCEVFHHLITCHMYRDDINQAIEACRSGLAIACGSAAGTGAAAAPPPSSPDAVRWHAHFIFRLAHCLFERDGDAEAALLVLEDLPPPQNLTVTEAALAAIARATLNLRLRRHEAALAELEASVECLKNFDDPSDADTPDVEALRGTYYLLYATMAVHAGQAAQLPQGDSSGAKTMFELMQDVYSMVGPHASKMDGWLPVPAASVAGRMMHAGLLRASGKCSEAAVELAMANEVVDVLPPELGIDWSAGEGRLGAAAAAEGRVWVRLKEAVIEQRVLAGLSATDLEAAASYAGELVTVMERFPRALQGQVPSACMVLGHYAHALGETDAAVAAFGAVSRGLDPHLRTIAAVAAALAELERQGGTKEAVNEAAGEWLRSLDLKHESPEAFTELPCQERAVAQMANGILLFRAGDLTGARMILTKSLKLAHGVIGSSQLIAQVLNVLAPVQAGRHDAAGARHMYQSSVTLLKTLNELASLVTALRGLHALHKEGSDAGVTEQSGKYLERKEDDWRARVKAVRGSEEHKKVMKGIEWLVGTVPQAEGEEG